MKTPTLLAALLAGLAAPAFAVEQSISLTQAGNANQATLTQSDGRANTVEQLQRGDGNRTTLEQRQAFGAQARIEQTSSGNGLQIVQQGSNQQIAVTQLEDGNHFADLSQIGGGAGNSLELEQRGNAASAYLHQAGDLNVYSVRQAGFGGNELRATATGDGNRLTVEQRSGGVAEVVQTGNGNAVQLTQSVSFAGGSATLRQQGADNSVQADQLTSRYRSALALTQTGNANQATLSQRAGFSDITFSQQGNANELSATQTGLEARIAGTSAGDANQASFVQSGVRVEAEIQQQGNGNLASIIQDTVPDSFSGASAMISQTGDAHSAVIDQIGSTARITQNGFGNQATIQQR
ncbi:hypothetical protein [Pseudomonas oryzihabitans]|uniref:Curlin n=1 Tax=Pseudomonas oryzihabitans TaxID=47885 RepID=A0A2Z5A215_9PSED|nr:hypothetical protein [Pseudomonas oryzihabitans]AXA64404.1 hypothetical protein CE139_00850 [Pseudomonas oryzihabitans]